MYDQSSSLADHKKWPMGGHTAPSRIEAASHHYDGEFLLIVHLRIIAIEPQRMMLRIARSWMRSSPRERCHMFPEFFHIHLADWYVMVHVEVGEQLMRQQYRKTPAVSMTIITTNMMAFKAPVPKHCPIQSQLHTTYAASNSQGTSRSRHPHKHSATPAPSRKILEPET